MPKQKAWRLLSLVPGWVGLLLATLPFLVTRSQAHATSVEVGPVPLSDLSSGLSGEVLVKAKNGEIYLSEDGTRFEELPLEASPEADDLLRLLQHATVAGSSDAIRVSPMIVADGAGGFNWARPSNEGASDGSAEKANEHGRTKRAGRSNVSAEESRR
jgi:hypothetical protein